MKLKGEKKCKIRNTKHKGENELKKRIQNPTIHEIIKQNKTKYKLNENTSLRRKVTRATRLSINSDQGDTLS